MLTTDDAVERATDLARTVLTDEADAVDRDARWPERGLRALQDAGLGGLVVPLECGGHGLGLVTLARVCQVLGEVCPSTAICFGMHCVGTAVIAAKATDDQRRRYLEPIASGRHLTTLALSEPGTGAHFYIPQTTIEEAGDVLRVTGVKTFVTNGGHADSYVMSAAAADPASAPGEFSCFVAQRDTPGLTWGEPWAGWGMRGNSATSATMERALIPRGDLLGRHGDEIWYVFNVIAPYFLIAMAGTYLGISTAALAEARRHVLARRYSFSGGTLAQSPIVQHAVGEMWARVERTRALIEHAAATADRGDPAALLALCSAKAEVADCADRVVADAMTLMGGLAYREEATIQRLYRDARAAHVMAPTTNLLRSWTGRAYLGLPVLGE